jgi:quinol monooxygenase YgiN
MVVAYVRYKIVPDNRVEFIESYRKASLQLDKSEFCLGYELAECEEEPGQFIFRIKWDSTDGHLKGFRNSDLFHDYSANLKPYANYIQEVKHYKLTDVISTK